MTDQAHPCPCGCGDTVIPGPRGKKYATHACATRAWRARRQTARVTSHPPRTQMEHVLLMLEQAGSAGVHTFEIRKAMIANPSQRIAEIEQQGFTVGRRRERLYGRSVGARYWLDHDPRQRGDV